MKKVIISSLSIITLLFATIAFYLFKPTVTAQLEQITLKNGQLIQIIKKADAKKNILILTPTNQTLNPAQLTALSGSGAFQIVQLSFNTKDCKEQQRILSTSLKELGNIDIMAGLGQASTQPLYWLIQQKNPSSIGLSIGFSAENNHCPLPNQQITGQWIVARNDSPDKKTSDYTKQQTNTKTLIGNYDNSLPELLVLQLNRLLQGNTINNLPLIEINPPANAQDIAIIFYSGDGGWRDLDRDVGNELAKLGYPVIGVDTLRYYWQRKEPSQAAADLASIMNKYNQKWHIKHFVLTGFSFGANVLPALYNRLTLEEQKKVLAVQLLAFSRGVNYEIKMAGWITETTTEAPTGSEVAKIPKEKLLCITGQDEANSSGCTLSSMKGTLITLSGGHHFDKNYPALAKRLAQHFIKNL